MRKRSVYLLPHTRGKKIIEKGTEEQKSNLRSGTIGMANVYNQIRRQEKKEDLIRQVQQTARAKFE
ncbi:MAG TPA: hypothetical protein VEL11_17865 [Candidatus Bathyarchaeia archaeon]|nr:hypothetical protein [Candidatus Bathyarchaeia archaeon]